MECSFAKVAERMESIEFLKKATNVYRTAQYIVKQHISICQSCDGDNVILSDDTYYVRTPQRDNDYEFCMMSRKHIDGKRMKSAMYTRRYVD